MAGTRTLRQSCRVKPEAALVACGLAVWGLLASADFLWQAGWDANLSLRQALNVSQRPAQTEAKLSHDREIALQRDFHASRESQREQAARVSRRLNHKIEQIAGTVTSIGLDLETLLPAAGQGGPLVTSAALSELAPQIERLRSLRALVRELPLSTPLNRFRLSSHFGKRHDPITGQSAHHRGVDLAARTGSSIVAPGHGRVVRAGWHGAYGRMVELDHGHGIRTRFGHLRAISVRRGQEVRKGERIGQLGNSGRSTGPHLHYEIRVRGRPTDPLKFLKASKALAASLDNQVK